MTPQLDHDDLWIYELEPECCEAHAGPLYRFSKQDSANGPARREFLKTLGAGLLVLSLVKNVQAQETAGKFPPVPPPPKEVGAWLHIGADGKVTVFTGKVEFGQNARTSLTQAVAEELGAPLSSVELVMGDTDRTPWDQGTLGSQTTPNMVPLLRKAAVAARGLLPAGPWSSINFADVAAKGTLNKAAVDALPVKPTAQWSVMGRAEKKIDGRDFVTGRHKYTSDMKVPGMLYGKVIRPEKFGATLTAFDAGAAAKLPGVTIVREGNFAGVVAPHPAQAEAAAKGVQATWKGDPQTSSKTLFTDLKAGVTLPVDPELEKALLASAHVLERTYNIAFIAHAPLEPRAAVAQWDGNKLNVWTGTQRPFSVRAEIAEAFQIPESDIRVMVPDTGSGYGGKHTGETAIEAARLAKAAGRPVKLVWTREEEFTWGYFRPGGVIDVRSGIDDKGLLTAWDFHDYSSGRAAIQPYYEIPRKRIDYHLVKSPLRQGSYRGLAATANNFARESQMDQLAVLVKQDPLEFRLQNTKDVRLKAVLEAAAQKFGWGNRKPGNGVGFGMGCGFEKGGYVATCAEVVVEKGRLVKIVRLVEAFECGAVINPDHLRMQIEGCMVMGLGGALYEAIEFADGKILNPRFSRYRVPRFRDIPPMDIVMVDRKDLPSAGGSETPIIGVAPAIGNAIASAGGDRPMSLPFA